MGRELQKVYGQPPQVVLMMPILEGLDGVQKMSKSLGNYIGIHESPAEIFGKLMSISDDLMWRYIDLLSFRTPTEIQRWKQSVTEGANPRDIKMAFAQEIVERFHHRQAAEQAYTEFVARFKEGELPQDLPEITVTTTDSIISIAHVLKSAGLVASTSEALRMIGQGAVKIDGERIGDRALQIAVDSIHIYQVGKRRYARVRIVAQ
jgi:tyrosyl-tRNA synthetase